MGVSPVIIHFRKPDFPVHKNHPAIGVPPFVESPISTARHARSSYGSSEALQRLSERRSPPVSEVQEVPGVHGEARGRGLVVIIASRENTLRDRGKKIEFA